MKKTFALMLTFVLLLTSLSVLRAAMAANGTVILIVTVQRVPIPKDKSFKSVTITDERGSDLMFPGEPNQWFKNAVFLDVAAPDPDGFIKGVSIDFETNEALMIEGGDRVNLSFSIDDNEYVFSFGPGS